MGLPGIEVEWIKVKLDTGARSSAIHAFDIAEFTRDDEPWVRFSVHPWQRTREDSVDVELPIHDRRHLITDEERASLAAAAGALGGEQARRD